MIITRSNYLIIEPKDSYERSCIKQLLDHECIRSNPKFEKMKKSGRFQKGIAQQIKTYKEEKGKFLIYKANYVVYKKLLDLGLPLEKLIDKRVSNKIDCESKVPPRDKEQLNAINDLYNWGISGFGYSCLEAVPAAGKTFCAVKLATMFKERTLVLVDMTLLIEQFIESIVKFTDIKEEEIGIIRGSELEYGDDKKIIIATVQTLVKKQNVIKELSEKIGFLVVDEVHVASANTFQDVIPKFKPMYQLGLSGSHNRDDKMDFLVKEAVGPIVHTITKEALIEAGSIMTPTLRPIFLKDDEKFERYNNDNTDFRTVVDEFYNCPKSINKITNIVMHYYKDRTQLLICKEKTMVFAYYEEILKKLLGIDAYNEALFFKENKLEEIKSDIKKLHNKSALDYMSKREKDALEQKLIKKTELIKKYTPRLEKELDKLNKLLDKTYKSEWFEQPNIVENDLTKSVVILTGDVKKEERDRIINETNDGKIHILIVTTTCDKAISINRLDTLYLLFSTRERANLIQRLGKLAKSAQYKLG